MIRVILLFILILLGISSCKKEVVQPQVNELDGTNWTHDLDGPGPKWLNMIEFKGDSIYQYTDSTDMLLYSGYTKNKNTLTIKDNYTFYWGDKKFLNTNPYTVQYKISNDSLYFNGVFKGVKN